MFASEVDQLRFWGDLVFGVKRLNSLPLLQAWRAGSEPRDAVGRTLLEEAERLGLEANQ